MSGIFGFPWRSRPGFRIVFEGVQSMSEQGVWVNLGSGGKLEQGALGTVQVQSTAWTWPWILGVNLKNWREGDDLKANTGFCSCRSHPCAWLLESEPSATYLRTRHMGKEPSIFPERMCAQLTDRHDQDSQCFGCLQKHSQCPRNGKNL